MRRERAAQCGQYTYRSSSLPVTVEAPSDRRLFAMCLLAAVSAFLIWMVALQDLGAFSMIVVAVLVFAVLMFIDGYRRSV